ncbi:MAG: hypothetical protein JOS17DRAFT_756150 [Linnemannia elongata]|nr:MAG: hypothetical protein JOS17DRAFT_756150 [Linnemannia elongata]
MDTALFSLLSTLSLSLCVCVCTFPRPSLCFTIIFSYLVFGKATTNTSDQLHQHRRTFTPRQKPPKDNSRYYFVIFLRLLIRKLRRK